MAELIRVFNPEKNKVKYVTEAVVKSGSLQKQGFIIQPAPKATPITKPVESPTVDPSQLDLETEAEKMGSVAPVDLKGLNTAESIEKLSQATIAELEATLLVEKRKGVKKYIETQLN